MLRFVLPAILVLPLPALADWSADFRVTSAPASSVTETDGGRNVVVGDGFVMVVWSDDRTGNREIWFRERLGDTWDAPVRLTTNPGTSLHPAIGRFSGEVRVAFQDDRTGHAEIWMKRKILGFWGSDSCLTCDAFESARPALDPRGVHLVWEETKDGNREIYYRKRATDGTWDAPFRVSNDPGESSHPSVASPTDINYVRSGPLPLALVVWQDDRDGNLEIYSRLSEDFIGWTPETRVTADSASSRFPSATAEWGDCSDAIAPVNRVVWQDDRHGNDEIYLAEGAFGTWSTESRITTTSTPSLHPSLFSAYHLAQGPFGLVPCTFPAIAWEERTAAGMPASIRYLDLGSTEPEVAVSDPGAQGGNPSVAIDHVQVVGEDGTRLAAVVWEDGRDGNLEIYFAENEEVFTVTGVPALVENPGSPELGLSRPNPFRAGTEFTVQLPAGTEIEVRVVDAAGREVTTLFRGPKPAGTHEFSWRGEGARGEPVAAGTYFVVVTDARGSTARRIVRLR